MKKLILSFIAIASLAFAANAVTNMCVKTDDGKVRFYDVNQVKRVFYLIDGVTVSGTVDNYTFVDLGLRSGVLWATYNVGATKPTEYGDYFAWGETSPKKDYIWGTYKLCEGSDSTLTKYCFNFNYGTYDKKKVLDAEDDAATANWGSAWRMPTKEELYELRESCDWQWVEDFNGSGVNGRLGTSKKNGATIFLPAAGYRSGTGLSNAGSGYYWSSSLYESSSSRAYFLRFSDVHFDRFDDYRFRGRSVRAVLR